MTPRRIFLSILVALALATAATPSAQTPLRPEPDPSKPQPAVEPRIERPDPKPDYPRDQIEAVQRRLQRLGGRVEMQSGPVIRLGTERVQIFRDYTLPRNEEVRELIGVLGDLRIEGRVSRNAVVTAGDLTLGPTAHVEGTVAVIGGSLTVEKGAFVGHEVIVIGGTANLPEGFQTSGEHVIIGTPEIASALRGVYPWVTRGLIFGRLIVPDLDWTWTVAVLSFLLGFVLHLLFNRPVTACADALARRPISALFVGILALLVAPLLFTLVAATAVGLLVVPSAIAGVIAAGMIGKAGVSPARGRGVAGATGPADRGQAARSFTIGAVLITLTYLLPVFGLIVWGMVGIFGLGAATMTMSGRLRRERPATPPFAPAGPTPATPPVVPAPAPAAAPAMTYAASAPPEPAFVSAPVTPAPEPATFAGTGLGDAGPAPGGPAMGRAASAQPLPPGSDLTLYPRATFFDRIAAMALDLMLIGIAMNLLDPRHIDSPPFVIIVFLYHVAFWAWKGTTLGGIVCNVRIVRTNGEPPRFIDALVRGLSGIFSVAALFIGVLWMLNDAEKQMWHDKIAGTVVVKLPRELVLA